MEVGKMIYLKFSGCTDMQKRIIKIFFSSSVKELGSERDNFHGIVNSVKKELEFMEQFKEYDIEAITWERDLGLSSSTSYQDMIDKVLPYVDYVVFAFCNKIGEYTRREYELVDKLPRVQTLILQKRYHKDICELSKEEIETYSQMIDYLNTTIELSSKKNIIPYETIEGFELRVKDDIRKFFLDTWWSDTFNRQKQLQLEVKPTTISQSQILSDAMKYMSIYQIKRIIMNY